MRIALFASLLGVQATGQSIYVANTAQRLQEAGHTVTVLATDCGYKGSDAGGFVKFAEGIDVHIFHSAGKLNRTLYRCPPLVSWLKQHIQEFDVLDIQGIWSWAGMNAASVFRDAKKPYVLTPHGVMTRYDWQKSMARRKLFFAVGFGEVWRKAQVIHFLSSGEVANSYLPPVGASRIIPNAVEPQPPVSTERKAEARARLELNREDQVLLFLGRVTHQKGVREIVEAFQLAAAANPKLVLLLVGPLEGEYAQGVQAAVKAAGLRHRMRLVGPVFGQEKQDYMAASDAAITLAHNEGMSIANLESFAAGLPMILTDGSNMDHFVQYRAGLLTTHDATIASQAILKVFSDETGLLQMSANARRLVEEKFSWAVVTPQMEEMYRLALSLV